jgi:hypothetical protein
MIRTIGSAIAPQQVRQQIMNRAAIVSNSMGSPQLGVVDAPVDEAGDDVNKLMGNLPQMGGAAATDYTVYTKSDLTLRRGEKAIVTLFRKRIKYSHAYRWELPGKIQHFLQLQNSTDTAWTTGPCLAISKDRPLSEDLLKYTPKGGFGEMPVTEAINVATERTESVLERKFKAHSPKENYWLDLVTLEGKLTVRNFEKRKIVVEIIAPVSGKPLAASEDGAFTQDTNKLRLLEQVGEIRWRIELDPDQVKTLTYKYERYVPSE